MRKLDRAFTPAPPELRDAVEQAFRRGEKKMKQRHKILTTVAAAAAVTVAFTAIALAAGRLNRRVPDQVAAPQPARVVRRTASPTPTPVPEAEVPWLWEGVYYATEDGNYFHLDEHCSGMQGAFPLEAEAASLMGKQPCPVCLGDAKLCWATEFGKYYHRDRNCSGMTGARLTTVYRARQEGKDPCPVCKGE